MIALLFYGAIALWALLAIYLGCKFPRWFKLKQAWTLLFTPLVFFAPVVDEVIGRWQFKQLCEEEAVIWLSPNWKSVEAVRDASPELFSEAEWTVISIKIQHEKLVDAKTGQPFMLYSALHTNGGFVLDKLGAGLGNTTSCWPEKIDEVYKMVNIDTLTQKVSSK